MATAKLSYEGQLRTRSVHLASKVELVTDAPVDNHGKGEAFSPTDLLASATVSCMMTLMGIKAQQKEWPLDGMTGEVEKVMSSDAPRRIVQLKIKISLAGELPEHAKDLLIFVAESCPVVMSLNPEIRLDFDWSDFLAS